MISQELDKFEKAKKALGEAESDKDYDSFDEDETNQEYKSYSKRVDLFHAEFTAEKLAWFNMNQMPVYCLAKHPKEGFNRVQVMLNEEGDKYRTFFVDFGDYASLSLADLMPTEEKFMKRLPFQAIECSLNGLKPLRHEKQWSRESDNTLWALTHDEDNRFEIMYAHVLNEFDKDGKSVAAPKRYSLRLECKSWPVDIDLAHQLVQKGVARFSSERIFPLFDIKDPEDEAANTIGFQFVNYFVRSVK